MLLAVLAGGAGRGETLSDYRARIDELDRRMVELLNERAEVVQRIGRLKRASGQPVSMPGREREVLRNAMAGARALPAPSVRRIYERILIEMKAAERAGMRK